MSMANKEGLLKSFLNFLKQKNSNFDFEIKDPKITKEKDRIDLTIRDDEFAALLKIKYLMHLIRPHNWQGTSTG